MEEKKYMVYKHTSPSGKCYIGITSYSNPKYRWGKNGNGYMKKSENGSYMQEPMAKAILKYGWDNIKHEVLISGLCKEEAERYERELIAYYDTCNSNKGYNVERGGLDAHTTGRITNAKKVADAKLRKKVNQYSLDGKFIKTYDGTVDASRDLIGNDGQKSSICNVCNFTKTNTGYTIKTASGYMWRWYDEFPDCKDIEPYEKKTNFEIRKQYAYEINRFGNVIALYKGFDVFDELANTTFNVSNCVNGRYVSANGRYFIKVEDYYTSRLDDYLDEISSKILLEARSNYNKIEQKRFKHDTILLLDKDNKIYKEFKSYAKCAEYFGIDNRHTPNRLHDENKLLNGYKIMKNSEFIATTY